MTTTPDKKHAMKSNDFKLDVLFVSEREIWPHHHPIQVQGYHLACACHELGLRVGHACMCPDPQSALPAWLDSVTIPWPTASQEDVQDLHQSWRGLFAATRLRLSRNQALNPAQLAGITPLIHQQQPKVVIGLGQHAPFFLRTVAAVCPLVKTVWYAMEEPVIYQLRHLQRDPAALWSARLRLVRQSLGIERLFANSIDGAIGASPTDTRSLIWLAGATHHTTISVRVDTDSFHPKPSAQQPRSIVFWGPMNERTYIEPVQWFAAKVWPRLTWRAPDAQFHVVAHNRAPEITHLRTVTGIIVHEQIEDIRPFAHRAQLAVVPMRGRREGDIRILEAAAMGKPIITSDRVHSGLKIPANQVPIYGCNSPEDWVEAVWRLWHDPGVRSQLGGAARNWVIDHRSPSGAALQLLDFLNQMLPARQKIHPEPVGDQAPYTLGALPLSVSHRRAA